MASSSAALSYSFAGKRVLVTGGGRGVGRELVTRLYIDGAQVFTLEKDPSLVEDLKKDFPNITAKQVDITNWTEAQTVVESFGPLDYLVNNAGIVCYNDFLDITEDRYERQMNTNLKGTLAISQAVANGMIAGGLKGSIVNVASCAGHIAVPSLAVYSLTKAGLLMLTKVMAKELGPHGIKCNSVSPTIIDTPMTHAGEATETAKASTLALLTRQPLEGENILKPGEVVDTILYLLSPLSSMANGVDVILDGGICIC